MGNWEEAVNVLALMKSEGVEPVLRTFKCVHALGMALQGAVCTACSQHACLVQHAALAAPPPSPLNPALATAPPPPSRSTLIIACNMCNQPREAMAVYRRMLEEGYSPNSVRSSPTPPQLHVQYEGLHALCVPGACSRPAYQVAPTSP